MRVALYTIGGVLALLSLAALAFLLLFDVNEYKPQLEAAASRALGMEVNLQGEMDLQLFPTLRVKLGDVRVRSRGSELAAIHDTELVLEPTALLQRQVEFGAISFKGALISIERGDDGRYNYETTTPAAGPAAPLALASVSLSDSTLRYLDRRSGTGFEARDCAVDLENLRHPGGDSTDFLRQLSLGAKGHCAAVKFDRYSLSELRFTLAGDDGVFDLKPVTLQLFGGHGQGSVKLNRRAAVPNYAVHFTLSQFRIEDYFATLSPKKTVDGLLDFSTKLTLHGSSSEQLRQSASGEIALHGNSLLLHGMDLDRELEEYEKSQRFDLVDVGAVFLAGPVGLAVTKGREFGSLLLKSGDSTRIQSLVSNWRLGASKLQAQDVALATTRHRLAMRGELNLADETFEEVYVAAVDAGGCATIAQRVHGPFREPQVDKPNFVVALAGPVLNLFKQTFRTISREQCTPFYTGSVTAPAPAAATQ